MALELLDLRYEVEKVKILVGGFPRWMELGYAAEQPQG
jgi:hypothetical protein